MLLLLQCITIAWFGMICRVAYRVLSGQGADDSRSDDEGEAEEEEIEQSEYVQKSIEKAPEAVQIQISEPQSPYEEEVGVDELTFVRKSSPKKGSRKSKSRSSGISLPGHGDHKELLGRIGCDKPS